MTAADARVERGLQEQGLEVKSYPGLLMREPQEVRIDMTGRWVGHFGTLSPFMRYGACHSTPCVNKLAYAGCSVRMLQHAACQ